MAIGGLCRRFWVSGRVQGVGFRYATASRARQLDLTGHAANLADGRVEVLACGSESALADLERWLDEGPSAAQVSAVVVEETACAKWPVEFGIR